MDIVKEYCLFNTLIRAYKANNIAKRTCNAYMLKKSSYVAELAKQERACWSKLTIQQKAEVLEKIYC